MTEAAGKGVGAEEVSEAEARDDDARDPDAGPERSCIVTRRKGPPEDFVRFVVGPDGAVVPDIRRKLPGRGAWVTADRTVLANAVKRKSFARAFKKPVDVSPILAETVDALLEKDALQALSIANKAGLIVAGSAKIEGSIGPHVPAALVHASDGSPDGTRKLEAAMRRRVGDKADAVLRIGIFRSDQLDLALGRTNVIHAAVSGGRAGDGFVSRAGRLMRFRGSLRDDAAAPGRDFDE